MHRPAIENTIKHRNILPFSTRLISSSHLDSLSFPLCRYILHFHTPRLNDAHTPSESHSL